MKFLIFLTLLLTVVNSPLAFSKSGQKVYNNDINIEGEADLEEANEDQELKAYKSELNNVKNLHNGFRKKKKVLKKLKTYAGKLVEEHKEFMEEKSEYEKEIGKFNKQVACVSNPNSKDCTGASTSKGQTYPSQVNALLAQYQNYFNQCFQKHLKKPRNGGVVVGGLRIDASGHLENIAWRQNANFNNGNVLRCFNGILTRLSFPKTPSQKTVIVNQPFSFHINKKGL